MAITNITGLGSCRAKNCKPSAVIIVKSKETNASLPRIMFLISRNDTNKEAITNSEIPVNTMKKSASIESAFSN